MRAATKSAPVAERRFLSVAEAAALSGLSKPTVYAAIVLGHLKASRPFGCRRWLIARADLDTYLAGSAPAVAS